LFEVDQAANRIREEVDPEAQIKVGSTLGDNLEGRIRVSVIATGIDSTATSRSSSGGGIAQIRPTVKVQAQPQATQVQTQAQTAYAQPVLRPAAVPVQKAVTPPAGTQTAYFTMPQTMQVEEEAETEESTAARSRMIDPEPAFEEQEEPVVDPVQVRVEEAHAPSPKYQAQAQVSARALQSQAMPTSSSRSARPASPMASSEMRMTQLTPSASSQNMSAEQRRQRRSESLFTRITGFGLVRPSSQNQEEELVGMNGQEEAPAQRQLGVSASDRPSLSSEQPDDLLEIPAFLRRQNNH
jgi:cell division protein FtsZ